MANKGLVKVDEAWQWVQKFMHGYNNEHQHSKIQCVTPAPRHRYEDKTILANRAHVYANAKGRNPKRWPSDIRDGSPVGDEALKRDQITKEKLKKIA